LAQFRLEFDLGAFLEEHGLGRFESALVDEGFEDAEALLEATSDDLDAVGMRTGHKRVMLRAQTALRDRLAQAGVPISDDGAVLRTVEPGVGGGRAVVTVAVPAEEEGAGAVLGMGRRGVDAVMTSPMGRGGVAHSRGVAPTQSPEPSMHLAADRDSKSGAAGDTTASAALGLPGSAAAGATELDGFVEDMARGRSERGSRVSGSRAGGASTDGGSRRDSRADSRDGRRFLEAQENMGSEIVLEILLAG
jgi:hypothetical protein